MPAGSPCPERQPARHAAASSTVHSAGGKETLPGQMGGPRPKPPPSMWAGSWGGREGDGWGGRARNTLHRDRDRRESQRQADSRRWCRLPLPHWLFICGGPLPGWGRLGGVAGVSLLPSPSHLPASFALMSLRPRCWERGKCLAWPLLPPARPRGVPSTQGSVVSTAAYSGAAGV